MVEANNRSKRVMRKAGFAAALALAIALPGWAQSRGGGSARTAGAHPSAHAAGRVGTPLNPDFAPLYGVPGLGFDYEHLAAVSRPGRENRGGRNRNGRTFLTPIFDYGFPYYYTFDTGEPYDYSLQAQAPPAPMVPPIPDADESSAEAAPPPPPSEPAAPPPELGQLILVRRDGQVVMAVAFTTSGGRLTYITQNGLRRSFPVSELDSDATRQMNDVNGTSVSLPD